MTDRRRPAIPTDKVFYLGVPDSKRRVERH